jgi:nicotinamidase/pyrazinamidase
MKKQLFESTSTGNNRAATPRDRAWNRLQSESATLCDGKTKLVEGTTRGTALLLHHGDALMVVDVQRDFLPGGQLPVPGGEEVIPPLNRYLAMFVSRNLPVFISGDFHPPNHCSFKQQGGPWPSHCLRTTEGAAFAKELALPDSATVIRKGHERGREAYSAFDGTDLAIRLRDLRVFRLFVGGLATEHCVRATTRDALRLGFEVFLLLDAIRAVNRNPQDGERAEKELIALGAVPTELEDMVHAY